MAHKYIICRNPTKLMKNRRNITNAYKLWLMTNDLYRLTGRTLLYPEQDKRFSAQRSNARREAMVVNGVLTGPC